MVENFKQILPKFVDYTKLYQHVSQENFILRRAHLSECGIIWLILQNAIARRKSDGSDQWQNGYPNMETIITDIQDNVAFVLEVNNEIIAYAAVIFDREPAYEEIDGKWLSRGDYAVIHRVAVSEKFAGKGIGTILFIKIEKFVQENALFSIKVDTNFDNLQMLKILDKLEYTYCGEVYFRGSARKAFEKILPAEIQRK